MTPFQYLQRAVLRQANRLYDFPLPPSIDENNLDALWVAFEKMDWSRDAFEEVRQNYQNTGIDAPNRGPEFCRIQAHYESEEVAAQMEDGVWVGWTYWHGGGKFGDPASIPWMEHAYFLDCIEKEVVTVVQTFTRKG